MPSFDLKGRKVTIIGAGRSGRAAAELVARMKGHPRISEWGKAPENDGWQQWQKNYGVESEWGGHTRPFIEKSDLLVLSPGVRRDAEPAVWARERNIPVIGEIELASRLCEASIIAVTGSNGKTTVTTLIAEILKADGRKTFLCGNIGQPFSDYALKAGRNDWVVLEVSSFQLETIVDFAPHIAVFLNFSQNHLDRHKDLDEYFAVKTRIFANQTEKDFAVLNYENPRIRVLADQLESRTRFFNSPEIITGSDIDNPNQLAVLAIGRILDIPEERVKKVLAGFKGVEHRMEVVRSVNGVDFINDSKATTPEAGEWALENLSRPVILICGGRDKNVDFTILRGAVENKVKKIFAIGEAKDKISEAFAPIVPVAFCETLEKAVRSAREEAAEGECVLLSPMCASFDMFMNYEERGRRFKDLVNRL